MKSVSKIKVCGFCGTKIPLRTCDECHELVPAPELTHVIHVDKTEQKLCNHCERLSYGKHVYDHSLKTFKVFNEREKLQHIHDNPTFAYLYIKQLLAQG